MNAARRSPGVRQRNLKLVLTYDGTDFAGWQRQANGLTVQQVLEEAVERVTGEEVRVTGAGRTDAGVHALGQVVNFHSRSRLSVAELQRALNAVLPPTVAVVDAQEAADDFHARYHATGKHYRYTIDNGPVRPVLDRNRVLHVQSRLNLTQMRLAAKGLMGEHDFAAFARHARREANTVRSLEELTIRRKGSRVLVDIIGSGFLYTMVRTIVGTLLEVGRGKLPAAAVADILKSRDRRRAGPTAPARGLCLVSVGYPEEEGEGHQR